MVIDMIKRIPRWVWLSLLVILLLFGVAMTWVLRPSVDASIQAMIPSTAIKTIRPTPLNGVYEVVAGQNIFYMQPGKPYLLVGHLFDLSTSQDLTQLTKDNDQAAQTPVAPQENNP